MTPNDPAWWDISVEDEDVLERIVERAASLTLLDRSGLHMDLHSVHVHNVPLKLEDFLVGQSSDFLHDIYGIHRHLDRGTGKLTDGFLPRFADVRP